MMQYAFVLGRVYTLSLAEIFLVLERLGYTIKILDVSPELLVVESEKMFNAEEIQKHLGGTVKILKIIDVVTKRANDSTNFALKNYFKPSKLKKDFLKSYKGKIQFGLSMYLLDMEARAFGEPLRIGMFIKRGMQDSGASIRLVLPEPNSLALASVVVTKNLLLEKGAEICVLVGTTKVYVARTLIVQDFEDYGRRDYQRPIRDEKQGMMPPKVAQQMINFAKAPKGSTLLDPMCGIGTLVQEGVLFGYKMLGTDNNPKAISGSETNLEWFRNRYKIAKGKYHVEVADVRSVSPLVEKLIGIKAISGVQGIVTEGYLGPAYGKYPKPQEIAQNFADLKELYTAAYEDFLKILPSGGRVVMCFPAYKKGRGQYEMLPNIDFITALGYNLVDVIPENLSRLLPFLQLTTRRTAIYDRKDQIVAREIVIFEKR
jgi:tRNA G10  N-methylase Trm11